MFFTFFDWSFESRLTQAASHLLRNLQVTTWLFRIAFGFFRFHINYPPLWQRSRFSAHGVLIGIRIWRAWSRSAKTPWALSPRRLRTWSCNTRFVTKPHHNRQRLLNRAFWDFPGGGLWDFGGGRPQVRLYTSGKTVTCVVSTYFKLAESDQWWSAWTWIILEPRATC